MLKIRCFQYNTLTLKVLIVRTILVLRQVDKFCGLWILPAPKRRLHSWRDTNTFPNVNYLHSTAGCLSPGFSWLNVEKSLGLLLFMLVTWNIVKSDIRNIAPSFVEIKTPQSFFMIKSILTSSCWKAKMVFIEFHQNVF